MAKVILVASGKGGVGKSTLTAGLGKALALQDKKVLLVDCDAGLASLEIILNVRENVLYNWIDVYKELCSADDAVIRVSDNLSLLPAPRSIVNDCPADCVKSVVSNYTDSYDYIFIDAPAGLSEGLERGAIASTAALVVATADEVSVSGAYALENTVSKLGVNNTRLIINRYDIKAVKKKKLLKIDEIINKTSVQLLGIVPEDKEIMYSSVTNKTYSKSSSTKAMQRIADRIDGNKVKLNISLLK